MVASEDEMLPVEELPIGYRFLPTDEELITSYLQKKVAFRAVPDQVIKDIDAGELYDSPPYTIVNFSTENSEREWYFFIRQSPRKQSEDKRSGSGLQSHLGKEGLQEEEEGQSGGFSFWRYIAEDSEKVIVREVGDGVGHWRSVAREPIHDTNGKIVAMKIHFVYFSGPRDQGRKTHWRMEEYHLTTPPQGEQQDSQIEEWALGRIKRGQDYT